MNTNGHAILGPSGSGTWLACPASIRMCQDIPSTSSVYAEEGTQFHTLCEVETRYRLLDGSEEDYVDGIMAWMAETEEEWQEDQWRYVKQWVAFLEDAMQDDPDAIVLLEQRVDTGVPGCWGTADVVIISLKYGWIRVIDIKYGAGIWVDAYENSQMMLYGVGGLGLVEEMGEKITRINDITVTVWQPRKNNVSDYTISRKDLVKWRDNIIPIAKLALGEDAPFGPSESACRFCPAAGICGPRARKMLEIDFGDPNVLDGDEMAEAYSRTSELKRWIADIENAALKMAYEEDGSVPGFKVVRSGGRRGITDDEKAIERLLAANFDPSDVIIRKVATLGKLDKLAGSPEELQQVLGDLLVKSEGRLSLAKDSDPRPPADAVHSAQDDFAGISNEGEA